MYILSALRGPSTHSPSPPQAVACLAWGHALSTHFQWDLFLSNHCKRNSSCYYAVIKSVFTALIRLFSIISCQLLLKWRDSIFAQLLLLLYQTDGLLDWRKMSNKDLAGVLFISHCMWNLLLKSTWNILLIKLYRITTYCSDRHTDSHYRVNYTLHSALPLWLWNHVP